MQIRLYIPTDEMIADSLTKPKSAHNNAIVEAARLGIYKMPNYYARGCVGNCMYDVVSHSC